MEKEKEKEKEMEMEKDEDWTPVDELVELRGGAPWICVPCKLSSRRVTYLREQYKEKQKHLNGKDGAVELDHNKYTVHI